MPITCRDLKEAQEVKDKLVREGYSNARIKKMRDGKYIVYTK